MILAEFSIAPLDAGESLSEQVAEALDIVDRSGVAYRLNPMGTVLEGEWSEVFGIIERCYQAMRQHSRRVSIAIKVDAREGASGRLDAKVAAVEQRLGRVLNK
ncbi:MAG: MTH1187 family thiamine-binding protein [Pseudomonadota bacterium]